MWIQLGNPCIQSIQLSDDGSLSRKILVRVRWLADKCLIDADAALSDPLREVHSETCAHGILCSVLREMYRLTDEVETICASLTVQVFKSDADLVEKYESLL